MLGEKFTSFYLPNCDKHGFYKAKQVDCPVYPNQWNLTLKRHTNTKMLIFFLFLSVWDISHRPASSLLVCVNLERKENPRIWWFNGWFPVSSGAHTVMTTYIYFHTISAPIYSYVYGSYMVLIFIKQVIDRIPPDVIIDLHKLLHWKHQDPNLGLYAPNDIHSAVLYSMLVMWRVCNSASVCVHCGLIHYNRVCTASVWSENCL